MKYNLLLLTSGVTFILSGCTTITDYSESVSRLERAIDESVTSIEAIDADMTAKQNKELKKMIMSNQLLLNPAENACAQGEQQCSLVTLKASEGKVEKYRAYPLTSMMPNSIKALEQVKLYVSRLKAIVDADTASKVTESVNATLGSLEQISSQLASEGAQGVNKENKISEYKAPIVGLIEWVTDKYVERVKKDALAKATLEAEPIIAKLTAFYAVSADAQKQADLAIFSKDFVNQQQQFDTVPITSASIDAYVSAAADYDVVLKAQAANPLLSFASAHEKLTAQLNGGGQASASLADVAAAIARLESEVKKVKALTDLFKKTNDAKKGE